MWKKKHNKNKIWYELEFDSGALIVQGTKSYNPLENLNGKICDLEQIHSAVIHRARADIKLVGDGLYTGENNFILSIKTADCLPIILYHPRKKILSLLHAGWRGTLLRITKKAILLLQSKYDLKGKELIAAFGPCINPDNYEIGEEVYKLFEQKNLPGVKKIEEGYYLDLKETNLAELKDKGIDEIYHFPEETCNSNIFYSHRKGEKGRNITAARII